MRAILKTIIPTFVYRKIHIIKANRDFAKWVQQGKPIPPPHLAKQLVINDYKEKFNISTLIETGTYNGDMVYAQLKNFKTIYSIELGKDLYEKAVNRFAKQKHVTIIHGDSGKVFIDLIPKIKDRAIFWLDGHYSAGNTAKGEKDCPIFEELNAILKSQYEHVLLIDDARCFNGEGDYPTIKGLSDYILSKKSNSKIEVKEDIIRVEL